MTRFAPVSTLSEVAVVDSTGKPGSTTAEGFLVVTVVLVLPVLLFLVHLAPFERFLYPLTNAAVAGYLYARRSHWYLAHCLLVFCFVSLVRRLVDAQAGWDPSNPILLAPYLCCLFTGISFFEYWGRRQPRHIGPVLVMLFCILYGTVLAILHGRVLAACVDALKWTVGPLLAVHMLANRDQLSEVRSIFEPCLLWAATAMGVYGIAQFVHPAPWDVLWMQAVTELGLGSIGQPDPFAVRVFSTMNSPGSLGVVLSAAIVVALKRPLPVSTLTITVAAIGLALCQYRSIWGATVLAVMMIILSPGAGLRFSNILALLVMGLALCSTALVPGVREAIVHRAASVTKLESDESLKTRLEQYSDLARSDDLIVGEGLAIAGASRRMDHQSPVAIDGAFIEIWRGMGVVVGTMFLAAMLSLILPLLSLSPALGNAVFFDRAIVIALFVQLPIGSVHTGELGFCGWLCLGFCHAARLNKLTHDAAKTATRNARAVVSGFRRISGGAT